MPIDLYICVIALLSRMRVIHCCFFLLDTHATLGFLCHAGRRSVQVHKVLFELVPYYKLFPQGTRNGIRRRPHL